MVLVVGATGLAGSQVCLQLLARGEKVRAFVRPSSAPEKLDTLRAAGAELCEGDLKDKDSVRRACDGVEAVISTASSTLSRQPGDNIQSVDLDGQLTLVRAAQETGIGRFILVSFRHANGLRSPLDAAKSKLEQAIQTLNFTVIQSSWFMDVWLTPALGFDPQAATARVYGNGANPISWVASWDVAHTCAAVLRDASAFQSVIEFGGPEALTPLQVVSIFERAGERTFSVEHVPEDALRQQYDSAADPMQKSFAALMLGCALGDEIAMQGVTDRFGLTLTRVEEYARRQYPHAARA